MMPIYLFDNRQNENIGINASDFKDQFLDICNEHRQTNRARVFAFILTDFQTTEANNFVLNNEFWNSLHTISGHFLTIFHLDFKNDDVNRLFRVGKTEYVREKYNNFFNALNEIFETADFIKIKMPSILFFQTDKEEILDFFCQELDSKHLQQNMNDLKDYIKSAVESVTYVTEENLNNSNEIYQLLKSNVESTKSKKVWATSFKKAVRLYELLN